MKHGNSIIKLGRNFTQRKALARQLASDLLLRGKIKTTLTKAKFIQPYIDRVINISKDKNLSSKRRLQILLNKQAEKKLRKELAVKYIDKKSGLTRIIKLLNRKGDNAKMAQIELI